MARLQTYSAATRHPCGSLRPAEPSPPISKPRRQHLHWRTSVRKVASQSLVLLFAILTLALSAQQIQKPEPTFILTIREDKSASLSNSELDRVLMQRTRILPAYELEQSHNEVKGMYKLIVLRDGRRADSLSGRSRCPANDRGTIVRSIDVEGTRKNGDAICSDHRNK